MLMIGISWLLYWLLIEIFSVEALHAALAVAIVFIVLGLFSSGDVRDSLKR